ncbi:hypothetical protein GGG16DRAFT_61292 [Schizophyllum commune]
MDAFPPTSNIPLASTGRTVRWQRFEKDNPLWLRDHIMDLQARLREAQMTLWTLCSKPDETGNIARQYRTQIHECPYFKGTLAGLLGQTTPTTKPQATPVDGLADLRQELKEVKALIEKTKPSPPPPTPPSPESFAAAASKAKPAPPRQPAQPKPAPPKPTLPSTTQHPPAPSKERPRLCLETEKGASDVISKVRPFEIVRLLSVALRASPRHSQVRVSAAKWTLLAATETILAALKSRIPIKSAGLVARWSKVVLPGIPTGVADDHPNTFTPDECHAHLCEHNPIYRMLKVTQLPSWVRDPESYEAGSSSSLTFAFEDPDGTLLRQVLASGPLFAFGAVARAKRWKSKPRKPTPPTQTSPPHDDKQPPPAPQHDPTRDVSPMEVEPTTQVTAASNAPGVTGLNPRSGAARRPPDHSPPAPEPKRRRRGGNRNDASSGLVGN